MESDANDALGRFARRSYQFCIRSRCLIITLKIFITPERISGSEKKQAENNNLNKLTINMNSPHMQHEKVEIKQNNI